MYKFTWKGKEILSFGRSAETNLTGAKILELFGGGPTNAGVQVNEDNSIGISAVYRAVRIISDSLALLPLQKFKETDKGREIVKDSIYTILHDQPNNYQTAFTFKQTLGGHQCLWGNAYARILRDGAGRVMQLIPIDPDNNTVTPKLDQKRLKIFYVVNNSEIVDQANMIHVPAFSFDGIEGKSPVRIARESLGLTKAAEEFGARFFGNGANMSGVLEHPGKLTEPAAERLKKDWDAKNSGLKNANKTTVLEEGMKYNRIGIPPEDAQFLQTRKFQVSEVARWFGVPPHLLSDLDRATFNSVEQLDIGFIKYCLNSWMEQWEQEYNRKLLTEEEKLKGYYFEHNIDGFLRGDIKTRTEYYSKMLAGRVLSPNEVRRMENRNDYPGGDEYANPNTTSSKQLQPTK